MQKKKSLFFLGRFFISRRMQEIGVRRQRESREAKNGNTFRILNTDSSIPLLILMYAVIIIGGGPAGLYNARARLKVLLLERLAAGRAGFNHGLGGELSRIPRRGIVI